MVGRQQPAKKGRRGALFVSSVRFSAVAAAGARVIGSHRTAALVGGLAGAVGRAACHPALAAGLAGLVGRELVRGSLFVRGPAAFARDLALALRIHRSEAAVRLSGAAFVALVA